MSSHSYNDYKQSYWNQQFENQNVEKQCQSVSLKSPLITQEY